MAKFLYNNIPQYTKEILNIMTDTNSSGEEVSTIEEFLDSIDEKVFDVLKAKVTEMLTFSDVDNIRIEYLPYLAYMLGYVWNYDLGNEYQRFLVKSLIDIYKRKGTKFSIHYSLYKHDSSLMIYEPYKDIFKTNKSAFSRTHKFASPDYYSNGIFVLKTDADPDIIRELVELVRPAGFKVVIEYRSVAYVDTTEKIEDNYAIRINEQVDLSDLPVTLQDHSRYSRLDIINKALIFEDFSGYRITGKGGLVGDEIFTSDVVNALSSGIRVFAGFDHNIDREAFGDPIYLGLKVFPWTSQITLNDLLYHTLTIRPTDGQSLNWSAVQYMEVTEIES